MEGTDHNRSPRFAVLNFDTPFGEAIPGSPKNPATETSDAVASTAAMAKSSSGQPPVIVFRRQATQAPSPNLAESTDDQGLDGLVDHQNSPISPLDPERQGDARPVDLETSAAKPGVLEDTLLRKPAVLSRPLESLELDKGYEFGPATTLAPGHFTQIRGKQRPADGDSCQHPKDALSRTSDEGRRAFLHDDCPLGIGSAEIATQNQLPLCTKQPESARSLGHEKSDDPVKTPPAREIRPAFGELPFPLISPREAPESSARARSAEAEEQPAVKVNHAAETSQMPTHFVANEGTQVPHLRLLRQHAPTSDHHGMSHHSVPMTRKQASPLSADRGRGSFSPQVGQAGNSRDVTNEPMPRSQAHMVSRPVREMAHARPARPLYRVRPESRSSNISKQRSRCGSLASSPNVRQRRVNINHDFTTSLAGVINQFTQQQNSALEEQRTKYHKYIKRLKRELADESDVVARQLSQLDAQGKEIEALQQSEKQLAGQLQDIETKLSMSESRVRKLEEKYSACKTHLNAAIREQQDLYIRSKEQWTNVIEQMRSMEKSCNAEAEMAVQKAEVIREQMTEKVRQAIAQNQTEAAKLYETINDLTARAEENEVELNKERESVRILSEKLQVLQGTSSGFEALAAQGKEIIEKIEEQQSKTEEQYRRSAEALRNKLDDVANRLDALSKMMAGESQDLDGIRQAQEKAYQSVTLKLDDILEQRNSANEATSQLSSDLEHHMERVWQRLDNQLESLSQQLAEKAEENGMASTLYVRKEAECKLHMEELAELRAAAEKQADHIQELEEAADALVTAHQEKEALARQLESLGTETAQLKEDNRSKDAAMAELQSKFDAAERTHASEVRNYNSNIQTLAQAIREKTRSTDIAVQQAAETARRECQFELEKTRKETERTLQDMKNQRDALTEQLENLRTTVHEQEQNAAQGAATIRSLQERLAAEETKGRVAAEQLAQRSTGLEQLEKKLTSQAEMFEAKLTIAKERVVDLEGESRRQRERSEALITGLERWAEREGHGIDNLRLLRNESSSADEISAALVKVLGNLSLSQRSDSGTFEETEPDRSFWEDSELLSSGQTLQDDTVSHPSTAYLMRDDIRDTLAESREQEEDAAKDPSANGLLPYSSTLHHLRRVVVRSPANVPNEPAAPSVDQEKTRRREAVQPRSIMKRVTRRTSSMLQQADSVAVAGQGAFKRSRQEAGLEQSFVPETGSTLPRVGGIPGPRAEPSKTSSRQPSKRQRSDTTKPGQSTGHTEQTTTKNSLKAAASTAEKPRSEHTMSMATLRRGSRSRRPEQPVEADSTWSLRSAVTPRSLSTLGTGSQNLSRTVSAGSTRGAGPRQTNVRTYGSRRAAGESSAAAGNTISGLTLRSQSQSRSQSQPQAQPRPQSRYWTRPAEESQDAITFSQRLGAGGSELPP